MKILRYCSAVCMVLGWTACHRAVQPAATTGALATGVVVTSTLRDTTPIIVPDLTYTPVLELSKTPCFGSCPVYVVKIYTSGIVQWEGIKNVDRIGKYTAEVSADWISDLLQSAENQGFYKMAHRYPANGTTVSDLPQTTITLSTHERGRYSVANIADAPLSLLQLQRDFEQKLEALDWRRVQ